MSEELTTADRVRGAAAGRTLCTLAEHHGITHAFGVVSIHNQPIVDALAADGRFVPVRHEATTVSAADGFSRVAETLGMAITSTGTGAGNAAGSLIEATTAGSRILHVTGNIESDYLGQGRGVIHETKAQDDMLAAVSKAAYTVRSPLDVATTLRKAASDAMSAPTGPVSVELPIDLQYAPEDVSSSSVVDRTGTSHTISGDIERAAAMLMAAERPVVWAGGGAIGARREIAEFCRRYGLPVFTSNAGRGVLPESDPLVIGNFAATDGGQRLLEQADLLLSIGTHFRSNETRHYKLRMPASHIQIDIESAALGRSYLCDVGIAGDAGTVIGALDQAVSGQMVEADEEGRAIWVNAAAETRSEVRRALATNIGPYDKLCQAMRTVLPDDAPLVRDVTIPASSWGNRLLDVLDPTTNVNARGGGIGQGLGMAIGAAAARPGAPTSLMVGDGGLMVHLGEFATVAQQQPWLLMIVFNDGGYGVLRNLQDAHFGHRSGVDLVNPDFSQLAAAFDLRYERLADPATAHRVLERSIAHHGPVVVEVDCNEFGPMTVPFVPPVPVH